LLHSFTIFHNQKNPLIQFQPTNQTSCLATETDLATMAPLRVTSYFMELRVMYVFGCMEGWIV
jgi:hypothetical protein